MENNIIDFCVSLSSRMIESGANLERVQLALARITRAYGLKDVSIYLLSNFISMGARLPDGTYISRQFSIPAADNNLQRLKQLNRLCYSVVNQKPKQEELNRLLEEASRTDSYPEWVINLAQIAGMSCVCMMFGGGLCEVLCIIGIVAALQQVIRIMSRPGLDQVVVNTVIMFTATMLAYLLETDFGAHLPTLVITAIIMIIPGISLVNAARNLFCGNEINGIIQILKITIETLALSGGIVLALMAFRWNGSVHDTVVYGPSHPALLIPLSFAVSLFVGITFRVSPHDLWLAGLGGAISRVMLIVLPNLWSNPFTYTLVAALVAALYAEYLASRRKDPSTYFIYPAILPMIPGGDFYYCLMGIYASDQNMFLTNLADCTLILAGMSIGFVVSSIVAHYIRKMRHVHIE